MADRFPLILNTSTNQIQEIPSGDSLDLTGSGIANAGIITAGNVTIGAATTDLVVTGDARITGILTIGTGSLTLDGSNNLVNVGTALTLGHSQGLQFHTQNLHSAGFEVNQINVSGASTIGGNLDANGDLDVDGHTNLDNVNVVGVVTVTGAVNASHSTFGNLNTTGITIQNTNASLNFTDTNNNPDYSIIVDAGVFDLNSVTPSVNIIKINTDGHIDIGTNVDFAAGIDVTGNITATGNVSGVDGTFTGNVSIGGTLTYEDVTNIDSVGIVTARQGIFVPDSQSIHLGNVAGGGDLQLTHNGSRSYIKDTGTGNLLIQGSQIALQDTSGNNHIITNAGTDVQLYYDFANNTTPKLKTTATGVTIDGTAVATTFTGNLTGTASKVNLISNNDNSAFRVPFTSGNTGSVDLYADNNSGMTYNPSTGLLYIAGTMEAGTLQGALNATTGSFSGDATFNGGAGAVTVAAASDIRIAGGSWTGEYTGGIKIQPDGSNSYFQYHGTMYFRNSGGANRFHFDSGGNATFVGSVTANGGFGGSGASLTNLNGSNIASGTVPVARIGTGTKNTSTFYRGDGTFATVTSITIQNNAANKLVLGSSTANTLSVTSQIGVSGGYLHCDNDNGGISFGTAGAGSFGTTPTIARAQQGGYHMSGSGAGDLCIGAEYQNDIRFGTSGASSGGLNTRLIIQSSGDVLPGTNGGQNLGNSGTRWSNIYTSDLQLSNEAKGGNDVDGTWGNYTIQEGESDLFLINNRSGKKYKFNLTEVS